MGSKQVIRVISGADSAAVILQCLNKTTACTTLAMTSHFIVVHIFVMQQASAQVFYTNAGYSLSCHVNLFFKLT